MTRTQTRTIAQRPLCLTNNKFHTSTTGHRLVFGTNADVATFVPNLAWNGTNPTNKNRTVLKSVRITLMTNVHIKMNSSHITQQHFLRLWAKFYYRTIH